MTTVDGGPVVAHAQAFADEINRRWGFTHILTYPGHQPDQQHALDNFQTRDVMLQLADWCTHDDIIDQYGIDYVIFNVDESTVGGEIYNREIARYWRHMPDRGSPTQNHHDHVHVSFNPTAKGPFGPPSPTPVPVDTVPAHVLEEGMFTVPPDSKPHNYPIPSWAKVVKPLSNGTTARAVILDKNDKVLAVHEKDFYAANEQFAMNVPAGAQCFGSTNFGPETLEVIYDVA